MTSVVILARTEGGSEAAFVLDCPPTVEGLRRLAALASMPGLTGPETTWTATPGRGPR